MVRPSYVLGGRAMEIMHDTPALAQLRRRTDGSFGEVPILIDSYLRNAIELDVDALSDGTDVYIGGIMEHIEEAGHPLRRLACSLPPYSLTRRRHRRHPQRQTAALAKALNVIGLMNVQFAVKDGDDYMLEVNPRASRTVPFVAQGHRRSARQTGGAGDGGRKARQAFARGKSPRNSLNRSTSR